MHFITADVFPFLVAVWNRLSRRSLWNSSERVLWAVLFVIWTFVQLSNCPFVRIFIYSNSRRALRITNIYFELGHLCGKRGNALLSTYFLCLLQGHKKTASEQSTVNRGVLGGCTHHRPRVELFGRPPPKSVDVFCNKSRWLQMCVYQRPLCCKNDHDRLLPIGLPTLNMDVSIEKTSEFWLPSSSSIKLSWPSWLVRQRKHDTFVHYTISVQSHPSHPLNKSHSTTDTHNFFSK